MIRRNASLSLIAVAGCATVNSTAVNPTAQIIKLSDLETEEDGFAEIDIEDINESISQKIVSNDNSYNIIDLCEPTDSRWDYPTDDQKRETRKLIKTTCSAMGVGQEDCKYFYGIIPSRESGYRPWVRHKLAADTSAALTSYINQSHSYGWSVRWKRTDMAAEDISKIEYLEYGDEQNEYFLYPERWMFGLGLGGINISYHLSKFDNMAPPEILCDPVVNTMIQVTIARTAVNRYGARNFAEIQAVYGGRTIYDDNGVIHPLSCTNGCPKYATKDQEEKARRGDKNILKRCKAHGLDCYKKPNLGSKLILDRMSTEDRYSAAESIRGEPLPEFDEVGDK